MRTVQASEGRVTFATGRAGQVPTPAERLQRLREAVEFARHAYAVHPCHFCEIRRAKAELAVDVYLERHPELTSTT